MTNVPSFDKTQQKTIEWLNDVRDTLELQDTHQAYAITRAVLHALRDRLTIEETFQLGEQMPMLMKGFYYEGYRPANKPDKISRAEFLEHILKEIDKSNLDISPEKGARGVLSVIEKRISMGEISDIKAILPAEFREYFNY